MTTDLRIAKTESGIWDLSIDENGDLASGDFLDSTLYYALFGERRASPSEVPESANRRGWIGNEGKDFENGSKLWIFEQSRITRSLLTDIQTTATSALQFLVDDNFATEVKATASLTNGVVVLRIEILISPSKIETRFFELWKNTGSRDGH